MRFFFQIKANNTRNEQYQRRTISELNKKKLNFDGATRYFIVLTSPSFANFWPRVAISSITCFAT